MSAAPVSPDFAGDAGFLCLLRGRQWDGYGPSKHGPLWNYRLLPGRAGDAGALLFMFIYDFTWSAFGSPEWARIALEIFCQYFPHKSPRAIRYILNFLVSIHLIERDPNDPWRFKTHPENVATAPLLMPVRHPNAAAKKRRARTASVSAPDSMAALRSAARVNSPEPPPPVEACFTGAAAESGVEAHFTAASDESLQTPGTGQSVNEPIQISPAGGDDSETVKPVSTDEKTGARMLKPVSIPVNPVSEIGQSVSDKNVKNDPPAETYCPWGWGCPFLVSDIAAHKPLTLITQSLQAGRPDPPMAPEVDRPATSAEIEQIRQLLRDELSDKFPGEDPGDALCDQVFRALNGAPIEWVTEGSKGIGLLRHLVRKKNCQFDNYGLSRVVAEGVGKQWRENRVKKRQQEQEQRERTVYSLTQQATESFCTLHETWQSLNHLAHAAVGRDRARSTSDAETVPSGAATPETRQGSLQRA